MPAMVGIPRDPYAIDTEFSENRTTKHVMGKIDAVRHMVGYPTRAGAGIEMLLVEGPRHVPRPCRCHAIAYYECRDDSTRDTYRVLAIERKIKRTNRAMSWCPAP